MHKLRLSLLIIVSIFSITTRASYKVYLLHGFGGLGLEMEGVHKAIEEEGYSCENYTYMSLVKDVDLVGQLLFNKIQADDIDTISFVTHSMGALVVRSLYEHMDSLTCFPFIHRIVMIAPPNNGSPVADFLVQFSFINSIIGPNINNLTTNPVTGAGKYPIPTCEVGLIAGTYGGDKGLNVFFTGENDGVLSPQQTKMGIEKDVVFVKSWHIGLLFNEKVMKLVVNFLENGNFTNESNTSVTEKRKIPIIRLIIEDVKVRLRGS